MPFQFPRIDSKLLQSVQKYPWALVIIVVCAIAGFFVTSYVNSNESRNEDCAEMKHYLQNQIDRKDSVIYNLQQQLIIERGASEKLPEKLDSLSKENKEDKK